MATKKKKVMKRSKDIGVLIPLFSITTCMTLDQCLRSIDGHIKATHVMGL